MYGGILVATRIGIRTLGELCKRVVKLEAKYNEPLSQRLTAPQKECLVALVEAAKCFIELVSANYDIGD